MAKCVHSDLYHSVSGTRLVLHEKMQVSMEWEGTELDKQFQTRKVLNFLVSFKIYTPGPTPASTTQLNCGV